MKLAFVSTMNGFAWGGSEELWVKTASYALDCGHQVFASIYDWGCLHPRIAELKSKGAIIHLRTRFYPSPLQRILRRCAKTLSLPFSTYKFLFHRFRKLVTFQPHLICISQGSTYELYCEPELCQLLLLNNCPYFLISQFNTETGVLPYDQLLLLSPLFSNASQIFFVAHRNRQTAMRQLASNLPNSTVLCNPVNISDTSIVAWNSSSKIKFASVARLDCKLKGQEILLQVLASALWRDRDWELNLYGSGPDEKYLKDLATFYNLSRAVNFAGHVDDIRRVWTDNHILVLPSIGEGTPLSLLEAMLCGRPSIVTDVGGNSDWIREPETGFIAETSSPKYFGAAMERAFQARDKWMQIGINAHNFATSQINLTPERTLLGSLTKARCPDETSQ